MNRSILDVAVIGAGHAGLSISYHFKQNGLKHIVFEQSRIGESWRSQRWDSFTVNSPNRMNVLPGFRYTGTDPDGFCTAKEFASYLEEYAAEFKLPVVENTQVISIAKPDGARYFTIRVSENGTIKTYQSEQVVVSSGSQSAKKVPSFAVNVDSEIKQLHTLEYRNASQLPDGAVLVVGSAQSGTQIAEDLAEAGRKVYLSTSMVARIPRRYRGCDIYDWLKKMAFFDLKTEAVTDPKIFAAKAPLLSGVGKLGHTISYQLLAKKGVTILGKMENADGQTTYFAANAAAHLKFGDGFSQKVKDMVDEYILKNRLSAPLPEDDFADMPDNDASCVSSLTSLDLKQHNIKTIIWTTGFSGDFSYLKLPVLNSEGTPKHVNGASDVKGLYFVGLSWLRARGSAIILGITEDAAFVADSVLSNSSVLELNN